MSIISISGRIGSGKDTLAKAIQYIEYKKTEGGLKYPDYNFESFSKFYWGPEAFGWTIKKFSYKLKQIASILTGIDIDKFESQEFKETFLSKEWNKDEVYVSPYDSFDIDNISVPMKVRDFLQKLGTEAIRDGLHTNTWLNALFVDYREDSDWIITDTRFQNEADKCKEMGALMVHIDRPDNPLPKSNHPSETSLDNYKFDLYINNTTIDNLLESAKSILDKINDKRNIRSK